MRVGQLLGALWPRHAAAVESQQTRATRPAFDADRDTRTECHLAAAAVDDNALLHWNRLGREAAAAHIERRREQHSVAAGPHHMPGRHEAKTLVSIRVY